MDLGNINAEGLTETSHRLPMMRCGEGRRWVPSPHPGGCISGSLILPMQLCVGDTEHHERLEFLRDKGWHPMYSSGKDSLSSRDHGDISAHLFYLWGALQFIRTLAPLRRQLGREQSTATYEQVGKELSRTPRGGREAAGTWCGQPEKVQGQGVTGASVGDFDLGSRGKRCSRFRGEVERTGKEGIIQVHGPHPPPYSTLTSSVSRRGISMEPRDMMRAEGERASCPSAPQQVLLASGSSRG